MDRQTEELGYRLSQVFVLADGEACARPSLAQQFYFDDSGFLPNAERLVRNRHRSIQDYWDYRSALTLLPISEEVSISEDCTAVHDLMTILLCNASFGNPDALADMQAVGFEAAGIVPPMQEQEIGEPGGVLIQALYSCVSPYTGELKTEEMRRVRELLHRHKVGPQFEEATLQQLAEKGVLSFCCKEAIPSDLS
jgi:hypothetical protein